MSDDFTIQQSGKTAKPATLEDMSEEDQVKYITKIDSKKKKEGPVKKLIQAGMKTTKNLDQLLIFGFSMLIWACGATLTLAGGFVYAGRYTYAAIAGGGSVLLFMCSMGLYFVSLFFPEGDLTRRMQETLVKYLQKQQKRDNKTQEYFKTIIDNRSHEKNYPER